ncbi:hypothetical protein A1O1_07219 [Capronia coronata CBS 617.96]|uniref:Uncharacterized protein n=1 Tax=Capronia coronata CBS 617.96 TaxID=1182541 RepID=W9Y2X9_9EURO|nr:uncharacterized protein A1O1_07219 [Capronia coronata CBS 617.96]EXJ83596.1 hypothetical protein A1O1_07219 [Capronia coronata CBS 617.96]
MSTTNAYYMHAQGVRPHHGSLWPEPQHCMPPANPQLPSSAYTTAAQAPQPVQTMMIAGHPPSDRILPTPISARGMVSTSATHMDNTPVSSSSQQDSTYWTGENTTPTHQSSTHVDTGATQEGPSERTTNSYRIQDMPYAQMGLNEALAPTSLSHSLAVPVNDAPASAIAHTPEDSHIPNTSSRPLSHESLKATPESTSGTYSYTDPMVGRSSQLRSASGQLSSGSLYCRTQAMVARREPAPDDCSPDCSSCQTDSTRTSVISIGNTSSRY